MPANPRRLVAEILGQLAPDKLPLDHLIEKHASKIETLSRQDEKLFYAILMGVLRRRSQLDWVLAQHAAKPLTRLKPQVLNLLRMGAFQILHLERVPDFAAVNTTVELAKKTHQAWATGLINGILRKISTRSATTTWPDPVTKPIPHLAVTTAMPQWLVERWHRQYGPAQTTAMCKAALQIPPMTLRCNPLKTNRDDLQSLLEPHVKSIAKTQYSLLGLHVRGLNKPLASLAPFAQGLFQVQDEAAQLAGLLCDLKAGDQALDACAGLGTKTGHLFSQIAPSGRLLALDPRQSKIKRLQKEMQRLGYDGVKARAISLQDFARQAPGPKFDCVLVDAPCSGWGVLRRNPDAKWRATPSQPLRMATTQKQLLAAAAPLVKPEGSLVYSVCTIEPEETDAIVDEFLAIHAQYEIEAATLWASKIGLRSELISTRGCLKIMPGHAEMDGFFAVRMRRHRA